MTTAENSTRPITGSAGGLQIDANRCLKSEHPFWNALAITNLRDAHGIRVASNISVVFGVPNGRVPSSMDALRLRQPKRQRHSGSARRRNDLHTRLWLDSEYGIGRMLRVQAVPPFGDRPIGELNHSTQLA